MKTHAPFFARYIGLLVVGWLLVPGLAQAGKLGLDPHFSEWEQIPVTAPVPGKARSASEMLDTPLQQVLAWLSEWSPVMLMTDGKRLEVTP